MKQLLLIVGAFILLSSSAVAGFYLYRLQQAAPAVEQLDIPVSAPDPETVLGTQRPEFSLLDSNGQMRNINEWDNKLIVINFWATWCPPCLKEIPEFVHLQNKYADQNLQFIGIALQKAEEVLDFMQEHNMNYPVLTGELEVVKVAKAYGNLYGALPYTVFLDKKGVINYVKAGPMTAQEAESILSKLL